MYSFQLITPLDGVPTALQVVYFGHEGGDERLATAGVTDLVEGYNQRVPPARLLVICPSGIEGKLQRAFDERRHEWRGRLASASHAVIAPYGKDGQLVADSIVHIKAGWNIEDAQVECFAQQAVSEILHDTNTILQAPHGYAFRKLSGREEDIFVRAGNMLRDPNCLPVFSYLLLRKLPSKCGLIYVDSFTILSFALGVQSLIDHFRHSEPDLPALAIKNFHSYQVAPEFRIPNEANYLILISASTSGGLAQKLISDKQADPARIVHLLGVGPSSCDFRDSCVFFKERGAQVPNTFPTSQRNAIIEIGTEEFLVAQGPPIPVPITRKHVNRDGARELHKSFYRAALRFYKPGVQSPHSTFAMADNPDNAQSSPMYTWVSDTLVHELPASLQMVVHVDDPMSEKFASWVQKALPGNIDIKSLSDIEQRTDFSPPSGAIVIVAYQDPGLEHLRRANIALRSIDPVHRHYVVGYVFPGSQGEYRRLKADLRMGSTGPQYGWSQYLVLPVGAANLHESLARFLESFDEQRIESLRNVSSPVADAIVAHDAQSSISESKPQHPIFLPRMDGKPLKLRHGSIFFPDNPEAAVSQITVYAMVSATVQAAREPDDQAEMDGRSSLPRFDDNPFVRSVLDPSMFARFNDGILQASLLRATQRSELDYSASNDLSRQFTAVCKTILSNHHHDMGEAALARILHECS